MSDLIPLPIFDITLSRTLAFADIEPKLIDYAIDIGLGSSIDAYGVSFALFTPADFLAFFGVAPQPRPPMGPCGPGRAEIAAWSKLDALTTQQKSKLVLLKNSLCTIFPRELLTPLEDNQGSLRARSSEFLFTSLKAQLGVLTSADLDVLHARLNKAYDRSIPVDTFVATLS